MTALMSRIGTGAALAVACSLAASAFARGASDRQASSSFRLTPDTLAALAECRAGFDVLLEVGTVVFAGQKPPSWMRAVDKTGHDGMMGLVTFRLRKPVTVFGMPTDRISFLKEWVVVERPREAALATIQAQDMKRAPFKVAEQYYRFTDPESGPMLGAFAPTDNALAMLLGAPAETAEPKTLFVGCNYAMASEEEFLKAAREADNMAGRASRDIERMLQDKP